MDIQHDSVLDARESVPLDIPTGELADILRKKIRTKWDAIKAEESEYLDPTQPFKPIDWAISIHGKGVFAFDDFNYIQGQSGNGKSFTMGIYEAVVFGAEFGDIKYIGNRKKPKILHIDTEQSEGNVQLHKVRVYHLAGWEQDSDHRDQFRILMLRQTPNPDERWAKIVRACYDFRPDFVFLDGMLDVVIGMNKEEDCNLVISEAETFTELLHMCMVGICHENPKRDTDTSDGAAKPAGHLGSFAQRKGSAGQGTKKKVVDVEPSFDVTPKKVRNKEYKGFRFTVKDVSIMIGGRMYTIGIPYWVESLEGKQSEPTDLDGQDAPTRKDGTFDENELRNMIDFAISTESLSFTTLREHIKNRYNIGSGRAKVAIDQAVRLGYLKCENSRYLKTIQSNLLDNPDEEDPFA